MSLKQFSRPIPNVVDYGNEYRLGVTSGIIPATPLAAAEVFQFRWAPITSRMAAIRAVQLSAAVTTTYFAAGVPVEFVLNRCSAWSVAGTVGTAVTPSTFGKMFSSMASSSLAAGDCRIINTDATGLGAGTKTIETNAIANMLVGAPITASLSGQIVMPGTYLLEPNLADGDYPLILKGLTAAVAEGFIIRATAPATGTWRLSVNVNWLETTDWPYIRSDG